MNEKNHIDNYLSRAKEQTKISIEDLSYILNDLNIDEKTQGKIFYHELIQESLNKQEEVTLS